MAPSSVRVLTNDLRLDVLEEGLTGEVLE